MVILKMFASMRTKIYKELDEIESRIALTIDMWTSNQRKGCMVVTTHYIDDEWKL